MSTKRRARRHTGRNQPVWVFPAPPAGWYCDCMNGVGGEQARAILKDANFNVKGYHVNGWAVPSEESLAAKSYLAEHGIWDWCS